MQPMQEITHRIGIVIVNYMNYADTVYYVNNDLLKQENISPFIVIVDNDSPNGSFERLNLEFEKNSAVTVIKSEKNRGYAAGNNEGIKFLEKKGYELVLITNNDIKLDDNHLLFKLINAYLSLDDAAFISPVMLVNGKVSKERSAWKLPDRASEILNSAYILRILGLPYLQTFFYSINTGRNECVKVDCLSGSFFLGSASTFKDIDYFDENTFLYFEETILGYKIKMRKKSNYLHQGLTYHHFLSNSINTHYNFIEKHAILLESKLYYWTHYRDSSELFCAVLKVLFIFFRAEYLVIRILTDMYKRMFHRNTKHTI